MADRNRFRRVAAAIPTHGMDASTQFASSLVWQGRRSLWSCEKASSRKQGIQRVGPPRRDSRRTPPTPTTPSSPSPSPESADSADSCRRASSPQPSTASCACKNDEMNVIQGLLSAVSPLSDGDSVDRLNYCLTTVTLVVTSAFVSGWSFVGSPIQCWFPAYYKGWWMEYALDYCYVQNTYFVPFVDETVHNAFDFGEHMVDVPRNYTDRQTTQIGYYQWVPFILAFQAIFFYLPVVLWRTVYEMSGVKVRAICDACSVSGNMEEKARQGNMKMIASFLTQEHAVAHVTSSVRSMSSDSFIVVTYVIIKALYVLNAFMQFVVLKNLLGVNSYTWGLDVTSDLWNGREWPETGNFPRVTMCDYDVRVLSNLHRHTVQCVLMINMFNEKIFVAMWYWLAIVLVVSLVSFIYWLVTSLGSRTGKQLVNSYMVKMENNSSVARGLDRRGLVQQFVVDYLRPDGVFLIRLISKNSGDMVTCSLLSTLWEDFTKNRRNPPPYSEPLLIGASKKIDDTEL
ncbi:unnamed protein product [Caenorhabditis auriculariae]|uniref:Innexin n=1 Tax=Caenorhabditis auriculariae TaxID=2777116 RepID=A0A8S1HIJ9_9PELO|nr:unnamed protein product [Caenorhabditis auriculariae]